MSPVHVDLSKRPDHAFIDFDASPNGLYRLNHGGQILFQQCLSGAASDGTSVAIRRNLVGYQRAFDDHVDLLGQGYRVQSASAFGKVNQ